MEQNNVKSEFKQKFKTYAGDQFEICYDIYTGLMSNEESDRIELLSYACRNFAITDSDKSFSPCGSGISKNEISNMKIQYGSVVDTFLESILQDAIASNMSSDIFYENIWNRIIQNNFFPTDKEKAFALYYILIDARIPYYPITSGVEMRNSDFKNLLDVCKDDIQKATFVLAVDFPQKTMEASNLVDILLAQDDYKKQVVIMSRIVLELRGRSQKLLSRLLDRINEDD